MQMLGINALIDIAALRASAGATSALVVLRAATTTTSTRSPGSSACMSGDPKLDASQVAPRLRLRGLRASCSACTASASTRPRTSAGAWDEALAAGRPPCSTSITDPEVPPLPPHIRFEQAKALASALRTGDPARGEIIRRSLKGKLAEFVNR